MLSSQSEINKKYFYEISKKHDSFFLIEKPCWDINPEEKLVYLAKKFTLIILEKLFLHLKN